MLPFFVDVPTTVAQGSVIDGDIHADVDLNFALDSLRTFFLSKAPPVKNVNLRSPSDKVGGLVYFGRMIDQIRAHSQGKLPPEYQATLGESLDEHCLNFLGVSYDLVGQYVSEGLSDEAILESCFGAGHRPSEAEIYMWNEFMLKRGWHDDASQTLKQLKRDEGFTARSEIETIFQLIDVAEGRALHSSHYYGSYLDQLSLTVNGRRFARASNESRAQTAFDRNGHSLTIS
jgi:hypothetical protein